MCFSFVADTEGAILRDFGNSNETTLDFMCMMVCHIWIWRIALIFLSIWLLFKCFYPVGWNRVVSRPGLFGPRFGLGSGLSLLKCFRPISGLHTKPFYNIQSNDFFLPWRTIVALNHGDCCEWSDCNFSSANSICKHSCVLLFSARISLTLHMRMLCRWGN